MAKEFLVIRDTREKQGLWFNSQPNGRCVGMEDAAMKTGDYTLKGMEDIICIERKASPAELAINVGKHKKRFDKEMERMKEIKHSFIICEFGFWDLFKFPENANSIPEEAKRDIRVTGRYVLRCLDEYRLKYNVHTIYCGDKLGAYKQVMALFKRVSDEYSG